MQPSQSEELQPKQRAKIADLLEVLKVSTKLGLTSFGGPIAHLGYFHHEYVRRRKWVDEQTYADLVALCQFLPGPASSQVGIGIGLLRAGAFGGIFAWLGFTLPSVAALVLFAIWVKGFDLGSAGWVHGLMIVGIAIVAQAVLSMGQKLTPDRGRVTIAAFAAMLTLLGHTAYSQLFILLAAGVGGLWFYRNKANQLVPDLPIALNRTFATICLVLFFGLLVFLPVCRALWGTSGLAMFDSYYRTGSLVFGGGHVVLPLLQQEVVSAGWVNQEDFLSGYGAAQAIPGPLFTFASYLGYVGGGLSGTVIATVGIFLPAFLLVAGVLPFWNKLRNDAKVQGALRGINAAVVGILLAALYDPLWTTAIMTPQDFALVVFLFVLLVFWKLPPWIVVLIGSMGGMVL